MRKALLTILGLTLLAFTMPAEALAQEAGDFRSATSGNWSAEATWESYDGSDWMSATTSPDGSGMITIRSDHTITVDVPVTVTGNVVVTETGELSVDAGSLVFADGSTYEHARDAGMVPSAAWEEGSTAMFTGLETDAPENRGQDYYNLTLDTPDLLSNKDLSLDGNTLGGDLTVLSSGMARWRLVGGSSGTVTIMGDVIVRNGAQLETQGTGSPTDVVVNHYGDIDVEGADFSISRGSQGSGTGTTTWNLLGGDFTMTDAETRNSNPTPGNAKLVFAGGGTQQLAFTDVEYAGGDVHFEVSDSTSLEIADGFEANGQFVNYGEVTALGSLTFLDGAVYNHARDAGAVPTATWEEGSTAMFTALETDAPENRGQSYYNLILDTPDLLSNKDLSLDGDTIGGDLTVLNSGSARWRLVGGSSGEVTIMGDVIVRNGSSLETQGTGSPTDVVVHHYGDIDVQDANFSVSRGSQGSGTGSTTWYLYDGDFNMTNAETRNSNPTPGNAKLVFASDSTQQLAWDNVEYAGGDVHFEVSDSTLLQIPNDFTSNGLFVNRGEVEAMGSVTFADGAVYEHAQDAGTMPSATWEEGSTAMLTGVETDAPENRGQDYYNLVLDTPDMLSNKDLSLDGNTISGDLTVLDSGARWRLVGGSSGEITIMGDVIVRGGDLETQGTGSPTDVVVHHHGNIDVDGGNFSVSRGSQGSGTGTTTWYLYEGDFSLANGQTRNSNPTPGNAKFVFTKDGVQTLTIGEGAEIDDLSILVEGGTTLDAGEDEIGGSGIFHMESGAGLVTAHEGGVAGTVQTSGEVSIADGTSHTFNGDVPQVTSVLMPTTVENLTADNEAGVTLSQATTVNGILTVESGKFDNTIPFTLGPDAELVINNGRLAVPMAQDGDYRAVASGSWTDAANWEVYDGSTWSAATTAPEGSESVMIADENAITVNAPLSVSGYIRVAGEGALDVADGSTLEFADGSTYEHARDAGAIPNATWLEGSTALLTGVATDAPENRGQDYYDLTLDTPDMLSNEDLSLGGHTISGDLTVLSSGGSRWRLIGGDSGEITIEGDVVVRGGQLETQGTGSPTDVVVHHWGDIDVDGGNFSVGRGSQGSGTGTTTWYLYEGDFTFTDGETRNSNPTPGNAKFVFASGEAQLLDFHDVEYGGGSVDFEISDSTTLQVHHFESSGLFVNRGEVEVQDSLTFLDGSTYEHARDGGSVPMAMWEEGSTALFTGIEADAPDNRGQDYYNLTLNTPDMVSNSDLSLDGNTIGGDLTVLDSGLARWRLVGGDSGEITIMGDVIVRGGSLETLGTGSPTEVVVHHYGNVDVDGGNFSVSRGSQGSGTGTTTWYLYEGDFSLANAETQNSNPTPGNARFVFTGTDVQELTLGDGAEISDLSIAVADSATLDVGESVIDGSGIFWLEPGAALATAHEEGVAGSIQTTGEISLDSEAGFWFNGSTPQVTSMLMPTVVEHLVIDNEAGVSLSQETTINGVLRLLAGEFDNTTPFTLGPDAEISREGGTLRVPVSTEPGAEIPEEFALHQNYPNPFNPSTVIQYDIRENADVTVKIFDVTGREIRTLVNEQHAPGTYKVQWNATGLSSGVYYYQIRAGDWTAAKSLLLVK